MNFYTSAEIAASRLDRLEREQDEQDDKESETNLQEAFSDKTKAVKLVIDQAKLSSSTPASCMVEKCSWSARTRGCKS